MSASQRHALCGSAGARAARLPGTAHGYPGTTAVHRLRGRPKRLPATWPAQRACSSAQPPAPSSQLGQHSARSTATSTTRGKNSPAIEITEECGWFGPSKVPGVWCNESRNAELNAVARMMHLWVQPSGPASARTTPPTNGHGRVHTNAELRELFMCCFRPAASVGAWLHPQNTVCRT